MTTVTEESTFTATVESPATLTLASAADILAKFIQPLTNRSRWLYDQHARINFLPNMIGSSDGIYSGKMFTATEDSLSEAIAQSADGTKMYVLTRTSGAGAYVWQYTLSTAWDISTAAYASKSVSVNSEDTDPEGLAFSSDGTKMYVLGPTADAVYQYTLSTAWDVSTASYDSVSKSVATEDTSPHGLAFSTDGTKMYVQGTNTNAVYQYTLSTAWDLSTAAYASKSLTGTNVQDTGMTDLFWSTDGTKVFLCGGTGDAVYQYNATTAWDISTASYASVSLDISGETTSVRGMTWSLDGTKLYVMDVDDEIYEYYTTRAVLD